MFPEMCFHVYHFHVELFMRFMLPERRGHTFSLCCYMAMGQNPNRTPSEHPNPHKIPTKMGGAPAPVKGFDPPPFVCCFW